MGLTRKERENAKRKGKGGALAQPKNAVAARLDLSKVLAELAPPAGAAGEGEGEGAPPAAGLEDADTTTR